jgi:hypothetical protein
MVGGICIKRSRIEAADCETLAAVPLVNACEPLVVRVPPPCVIWLAPATTPKSDRSTKDFKVVVVYLVLQSFLANLVKTVELVKINRIAIRHNQAVKDDSHPPLLAEARRTNLFRFPEDDGPVRDNDVLVVMRVHRVRDEHFDGAYRISVKAIHQNGIEN